MTTKDRLKEFLSFKKIGRNKFEERAKIAIGYMSSKSISISSDVIEKTAVLFPDLNIEWLITGNGGMLRNAERADKTVSVSQSSISEGNHKGALIYDIDATCGTDSRAIEFTNERVIGSIDAPEINPNSQIIFATGNSMQPLIYSGDRIVVRKIENWDYFNYGQVYLIITNEYRMIKRVRKWKDDETNYIWLISENPDHDDFQLHRSKIVHLYLVENVLSIKNL